MKQRGTGVSMPCPSESENKGSKSSDSNNAHGYNDLCLGYNTWQKSREGRKEWRHNLSVISVTHITQVLSSCTFFQHFDED